MNSKIRVDPKTFKIINQKQEKESLSSDSETMTSLTSESSSGSDSESIRVIKLDGGNFQKQSSQSQPTQLEQSQKQPPQSQQSQQQQSQQQQSQSQKPRSVSSETNIDNYLLSNPKESYSQLNNDEESTKETIEESTRDSRELSSEEPIVKKNKESTDEPDVIDLSESKLFDILHNIFTDSNGISVSENIEKMSKLFDKHNQIMEKILDQLIIMNSNHKQIRVPEVVQTNTKIANNDFRQTSQK